MADKPAAVMDFIEVARDLKRLGVSGATPFIVETHISISLFSTSFFMLFVLVPLECWNCIGTVIVIGAEKYKLFISALLYSYYLVLNIINVLNKY